MVVLNFEGVAWKCADKERSEIEIENNYGANFLANYDF